MAGVSIVAMGASLGGLSALQVVLSGMPVERLPPIVIVQHRRQEDDDGLGSHLGRVTHVPITEPCDKEALEAGHVYLAPAGYHLLVEPGSFALSTEASVNHSRPSIDVLFESAADAYGRGVIGVILTGASADGARGCARVKERGGVVLVQDATDAEAGTMPAAAIAATHVDEVVALRELPHVLCRRCLAGGR